MSPRSTWGVLCGCNGGSAKSCEDKTEMTRDCRLELERQREFLQSGVGKSIYFATSLYFMGMIFAQKAGVRVDPLWTAYCVSGWILVTGSGVGSGRFRDKSMKWTRYSMRPGNGFAI